MHDHDHLPSPPCITVDDLRRLERKVDSLTTALIGDPSIGHRGIVPRLDLVETTIARIAAEREAEKSKRAGAFAVIGALAALAGALGGIAHWLFTTLTGRA